MHSDHSYVAHRYGVSPGQLQSPLTATPTGTFPIRPPSAARHTGHAAHATAAATISSMKRDIERRDLSATILRTIVS